MSSDWHMLVQGSHRVTTWLGSFATNFQTHLTPAGVAALFVLAGTCAAYAGISFYTRPGRDLDAILQPYRPSEASTSDAKPNLASAIRPLLRRASNVLIGIVESRGKRPALEQMLVRAGLPIAAGEFLLICASGFVIATSAGALLAGIGGMLLAMAFSAVLPIGVVRLRADRRHRAFDAQLPDVLKIVASSLRGGFSLLQSLTSVIEQCPDPMRHELQIAIARIRFGEPIEDALYDVATRTGSQDFRWTVMAIRIQREVGGNLSGILDTVASTMLERERIRREVRTLTAEGRISAIILAAMPVALALFIFMINRGYMSLLFDSFSGQMALGVGVAMEIFGGIWMSRTIKIVV